MRRPEPSVKYNSPTPRLINPPYGLCVIKNLASLVASNVADPRSTIMRLSFISKGAFGCLGVARRAAWVVFLMLVLAAPPQAWSQSSESVKIVPGQTYVITGVAKMET